MSGACWREGPNNPLGVQNLRKAKDVVSEKHIEKSAERTGLTLRYSLGDGGQSWLGARLLDAVKRIQREYKDEDFGVEDASPLLVEILAKPFPLKFRLPNLDKYHRKSNPISYLANFRTTMLL